MDAFLWPGSKKAIFLADLNGDSLADLVVVATHPAGFSGGVLAGRWSRQFYRMHWLELHCDFAWKQGHEHPDVTGAS